MHTHRIKEVGLKSKTGTIHGRLSSAAIALLVLSVQVLLPIAPVFADESLAAPQSPDVVPASVIETEPVVVEGPQAVEDIPTTPPTDTAGVPTEIGIMIENAADQLMDDASEENTAVIGTGKDNATSTEEVVMDGRIETPSGVSSSTSEVHAETPDVESPTAEEEVQLPDMSEEVAEVVSPPVDTETETDTTDELTEVTNASTTPEQTVLPPEVHTVTTDANRFSFGVEDCAQVADGSFYCRSKEEVVTPITTDRVFAGPDRDGDGEIYIERNGEVTQISHNLVDDGAPYYDVESETIVWHRLVDARYQIVSYDLATREEIVLTNDHYNNMQPSRAGDITVWQGWIGNDWEILSMVDGEITMLTDNTLHDIGPRINGEYVIWQADEADGWKVRVYDRLTKQTETIADADGASIENPRFVLLYDAKRENGDIETRGYDLESGKSVPLSAQPHRIPDEIPDPEQTGEDRALIVSATQLKIKSEEDSEPDTDTLDRTVPPVTGTTTGDVIIPPFGTKDLDEDSATTGLASSTLDLVVDPLEEIPDIEIPDLIVLPYAEELDSQDEVATTP